MKLYREITPLQKKDFFGIYHYPTATFDYPLHSHSEYELNLVLNGAGNRVVGDKIDKYEGLDLVLLGPNLTHCWDNVDVDTNKYPLTSVIFIHFEESLFDYLSMKEVFAPIKMMLQYATRGIEFSGKTRTKVKKQLKAMLKQEPFEASISFLKLLQLLATSTESKLIASPGHTTKIIPKESQRIETIYAFLQDNFHKPIKVEEVAAMVNMSVSAFSHYFKKSTNRSFMRFLTEVRLGQACGLLTTTQMDISEIAFATGYANISNFNRLFKKYKGCTPVQFRNKIAYNFPSSSERYFLK